MPRDLLLYIFFIVTGLENNKVARVGTYYQLVFVIKLVCRHWNSIINTSAKTWALIDVTRPNAVRMSLSRSNNCSLRLFCCDLYQNAKQIKSSVEILSPHMERVIQLQAIVDGAQRTALMPLLQAQASRMEMLHLSVVTKSAQPFQLFGEPAFRMSSLLLSGIQIDLPTLKPKCLRRITIAGLAASLNTILDMLKACSNQVEVVVLDSIDFRESYGVHQVCSEAITLPNLGRVRLFHIEPFAIEHILGSLDIPACVECRIAGTPFAGRPLNGVLQQFMDKVLLWDSLKTISDNNRVVFDALGAAFYLGPANLRDVWEVGYSFHFDCDHWGPSPVAVWEEMFRAFVRPWAERGNFKPAFISVPRPYSLNENRLPPIEVSKGAAK
ncbi:hypothetical protein FRB90_003074 [Tulasnella sp. 427]|nr:hypothetical protein FRB90_003074 [Tulasnella sp. 427]